MADNTPATQEVVSAPKTEIQPEATTKDGLTPEFAKGTAEIAAEKEKINVNAIEAEIVTPAPQEEEEATLKRRLNGAISEVEKRNEDARRYVDLQSEQVRENNELIHKVAASDPVLANKVVQKVWGFQGIKSYKQLVERSKLEELKMSNPDVYETKRKLMDVETRLANAEQKEQRIIRNKFLAEKGIQENEYDPNYRKLLESLDNLNPELISEDYEKALRSAYAIGFNEGSVVTTHIKEAPTLQIGGGNKPIPIPSSQPQRSDTSTWLARSLNERLGYNIPI